MKELLTYSRSQSFKQCRKRHYWEYEVGIRPASDAKALRMGSAYHAGLDTLKLGWGEDAACAAVRSHYDQYPLPETVSGQDYRDMEVETVVALVAGYQWRWQEQPLEVLASEKAFQGQLVNRLTKGVCRVFDIAGKIDGIVKLEDGRIAVLEHKLQSDDLDPGSDYWRRLQMDLQVSFYVYAARSLGFKVDTVLFDVARKPSIKPSAVPLVDEDGFKIVLDKDGQRVMTKDGKKPRESGDTAAGYTLQVRPMAADEWVDRLLEDIGNRPTWYYARQEVPRLDQDIDEMRDELWDLQNVLRDAQRNGRWYRTVTRECPFCPYFSLCTSKYDPQRSLVPDGFTFISNKHPELGDIDATNSSPT